MSISEKFVTSIFTVEGGSGRFLQNVDTYPPNKMATHDMKLKSLCSPPLEFGTYVASSAM
jgi:hypothetical protein